MPENTLIIQNLHFSYENSLNSFMMNISQLELHFSSGIGILGPSGSGKTTLSKIIAGLLKPAKGSISIRQQGYLLPQQEIRYLPQFPEKLFLLRRVGETVQYISKRGNDPGYRDRLINIWCELDLNNIEIEGKYLEQLSGGEVRLVALSLLLATNARVYILDEPIIGVSEYFQKRLTPLLNGLIADDRLLLIISHKVNLLEELIDTVILLDHGQIQESGSLKDYDLAKFRYRL